jgi:hypothetical protein
MKSYQVYGALLALAAVAAGWSVEARAEERSAKNSIFVEALGNGILYSINYDRLVIDALSVRLGLMYLSIGASSTSDSGTTSASVTLISVPIVANYVGLYSGSHGLEAGAGASLVYASGEGSGFGYSTSSSGVGGYLTVNVGYRLQPVDGGFQFRIGAMALIGPGFGDKGGWGALPWGNMSLGYTF